MSRAAVFRRCCVETIEPRQTCVPVDVVLWNPWIAKAKVSHRCCSNRVRVRDRGVPCSQTPSRRYLPPYFRIVDCWDRRIALGANTKVLPILFGRGFLFLDRLLVPQLLFASSTPISFPFGTAAFALGRASLPTPHHACIDCSEIRCACRSQHQMRGPQTSQLPLYIDSSLRISMPLNILLSALFNGAR